MMATKEKQGSALVLFGIAVTAIGCVMALYEFRMGNVSTTRHILACTACMWLVSMLLKWKM